MRRSENRVVNGAYIEAFTSHHWRAGTNVDCPDIFLHINVVLTTYDNMYLVIIHQPADLISISMVRSQWAPLARRKLLL